MAGPEIVAAASIASVGLSAGKEIFAGHGESETQQFLAARDARAAELAKLRAAQTDVHLREELNTTLGNIDAIRAAGNIDINSPTTAAVKAREAEVSDRERRTRVTSELAQAREFELSSAYRRKLGDRAIISGYIGGATKLAGGIGSMRK